MRKPGLFVGLGWDLNEIGLRLAGGIGSITH